MSLTVVTPVLNEANFIKAWCTQVSKIADQVVVLDTGSNDGTQDIVRKFKHVELIHYPQNAKPYHWNEAEVRNKLIELSRCDWIMILDADELMTNSEALKDELKFIRQDFISYPSKDFWLTPWLVRTGDYRNGLNDLRRFHPTRRVRVFSKQKYIRYAMKTGTGRSAHAYLEWYGLWKYGYRFSHFKSKASECFHYNYCSGHAKENGNRAPQLNVPQLLTSYPGLHPTETTLYPWWKAK